jgi:hypothetical protein
MTTEDWEEERVAGAKAEDAREANEEDEAGDDSAAMRDGSDERLNVGAMGEEKVRGEADSEREMAHRLLALHRCSAVRKAIVTTAAGDAQDKRWRARSGGA